MIGGVIAKAELVIEDVCVSVRDLFAARGLTTTFRMGMQYVEEEGNANRVVFVPGASTSTSGVQRLSAKQGAVLNDICTAYIWGVNASDDDGFAQFTSAKAIMVEVIGALRIVNGGRVKFIDQSLDEITHSVKYGEQYQFRFGFDGPIEIVSAFEPKTGIKPVVSAEVRDDAP